MRLRTTMAWMLGSAAVALVVAIVSFLLADHGTRIGSALRATARWSFVLFWCASIGSALTTLFGPRFRALARHARDLGLSFASAHLVHLGLVVLLYLITRHPFGAFTIIVFGIAVFCTYLLAFLSIHGVAAKLSPGKLRLVRTVGVEYISVAFIIDFAKNPLEGGIEHLIYYAPFLALSIIGPLLRVAALAKRAAVARRLITS
jgi:hypothetical protein